MMRRIILIVIAALLAGLAQAASASAAGPATGPAGKAPTSGSARAGTAPARPRDQILSNERTITRWAYENWPAAIRVAPRSSARRFTSLHGYTEDGFSEVYLLLRAHWDSHGREWIKLRIPMRPNGRVGWVPRSALGTFHLTHLLVVVDRRSLRLRFYRDGWLIWSAPVGVGAPGTPTPAGRFWIREVFKIGSPASGYYPFAFGTADYSTLTDWPGGGVVGIHGPYFAPPQAIPGRISHGCIRLRVADDAWLGRHIGIGVPVRVV